MSKVLSFLAAYSCLKWFERFFTPAYAKEDVEEMAKKYEEYQKSSFGELESKLNTLKEENEKAVSEYKTKIRNLEDKLNEQANNNGLIISERERVITNLKNEVSSLKQDVKEANNSCNESIKRIRTECDNKVKKIQKECADSLLKADKKATKEAEKKESVKKPRNPNNTGKAELTCEQVLEIRELASKSSKPTNKELAEKYGVGPSTISRVISGKSYKQCIIPEKKDKKAK